MRDEFNVVQFFMDDSYEYVRRFVSAEDAFKAVKHYTSNVAVRMGITKKVIITDGGDCTVFEWTAKDGITFPKVEKSDERGGEEPWGTVGSDLPKQGKKSPVSTKPKVPRRD